MKIFAAMVCGAALAGQAAAQGSDSDAGLPQCSIEAAKVGALLPFGCANRLNLQAMIDVSADLSGGQSAPPPVGEPAVRAVGRHRDGQAVPLPTSSSMEAPGVSVRAER